MANWSAPLIDQLPSTPLELAEKWPAGDYEAEAEAFHQHSLRRGDRRVNWNGVWALPNPAVMRASKAGVQFCANQPSAA